jgi:hypothetical protein
MKFNPITKKLYTDSGELIKRLHCPLRMQWAQLRQNPVTPHRMCIACERTVLDTDDMTDAELLAKVQAHPSICLSVSARQANVTIIAEDPTPHSS